MPFLGIFGVKCAVWQIGSLKSYYLSCASPALHNMCVTGETVFKSCCLHRHVPVGNKENSWCVCVCGVVSDVVCLSWASLVLNVLYGR